MNVCATHLEVWRLAIRLRMALLLPAGVHRMPWSFTFSCVILVELKKQLYRLQVDQISMMSPQQVKFARLCRRPEYFYKAYIVVQMWPFCLFASKPILTWLWLSFRLWCRAAGTGYCCATATRKSARIVAPVVHLFQAGPAGIGLHF